MFLLDAGGPLLLLVPLIFFMLIAVLGEAWIMKLLDYNNFGRCFSDSLRMNLTSLVAGFVMFDFVNEKIGSNIGIFIFFFLVTLLIEGIILYLFNRDKPLKQTVNATLITNLASYLILGTMVMFFAK